MKFRPATSEGEYGLAEHVRVCVIGQQVILLDLKSSRYIGITARDWRALGFLANGETSPGAMPASIPARHDLPVFRSACSQGLLSRVPTVAHSGMELLAATASLDPGGVSPPPVSCSTDVVRFFASAAAAALWLRCRTLHAVALWVETNKCRRQTHDMRNAADLHRLVSLFDKWRPLAFTARNRCLHDSLALVNFLTRADHLPQWVIGVKTQPFAAHSWVQAGSLVLNDLHENVRRFRPILVV